MIYVDGHYEYVHRRVMEAHLGRRLDATETVRHKDDNFLNNAIENLLLVVGKHPECWVYLRCENCNNPIERRAYHAARRRYNFCSPACYAEARRKGLYDG